MVKLVFPKDETLFDTHTNVQNTFIREVGENGIESTLEWLTSMKNSA
ncbi:MAG: hypothetical protein IJX87_05935 [Clostridia bacterium]|nr:hypothetical protein [Clostridia bacterium]